MKRKNSPSQNAIGNEFGGLVKGIVSSAGTCISAGANFLEAAEYALVDCVGALYLISPVSVRHPRINFELGAMWSRGAGSRTRRARITPSHAVALASNVASPIS